jgi:hypothetical protein
MNRTEANPSGGNGAARTLENWKLAGTLVRFAELLREESGKDEDLCRKAYKSGKADGLAFARELLLEFNGNGHVRATRAGDALGLASSPLPADAVPGDLAVQSAVRGDLIGPLTGPSTGSGPTVRALLSE